MNRKFLNYVIFFAIVAVVVGLAVRHSRYMRGLVDGMAGPSKAERIARARTLVQGDQFMDAITGESVAKRVAIGQALEDWACEPPPAQKPPADAKGAHPKDAIKQMIAFMKDPDRPVRDRLLLAMVASATKSDDNLTEAVNGLKEGDPNARKAIVAALRVVGQADAQQAAALLEKATPENKPEQRAHAVSQIDRAIGAALIDKTVALMKASGDARTPGGDVLGALAGSREKSIAALMPLLKDKDADTRTGAAAAMGKVGSRTPVPDLIAMMRTDSAKNRRIAIVAIAMIADVSGEAPLREALANVRDDSEGRIQAALGLGRIATPTATAALTRALTDYDLRVVAAAVTGLATSGVAAIPSLSASAKSPNALVRLHSVEALGKIVDSAANPSLIGALNDTDARVRLAAAASLGFAGNSGGVAPLVAKLGGPDAALSTAAADALAQIGAVAQPALVQALGGTDQAAYFAAQALSRMGAPAVRAVERAANAGGTAARWSAVALGGIGSPEAVVVLRRLVASPNAEVSTAATASLQRLGLM